MIAISGIAVANQRSCCCIGRGHRRYDCSRCNCCTSGDGPQQTYEQCNGCV